MFDFRLIRNLTGLALIVAATSFSLTEVYQHPSEVAKREKNSRMAEIVKIRMIMKTEKLRRR